MKSNTAGTHILEISIPTGKSQFIRRISLVFLQSEDEKLSAIHTLKQRRLIHIFGNLEHANTWMRNFFETAISSTYSRSRNFDYKPTGLTVQQSAR
jgi:hypothetical protein